MKWSKELWNHVSYFASGIAHHLHNERTEGLMIFWNLFQWIVTWAHCIVHQTNGKLSLSENCKIFFFEYWLIFGFVCLFCHFGIFWYIKTWVFFLKSNLNYIQLNPSLYMQLGCPRGFESRMRYMLSERAHFNMCYFFVYQVSKRLCSYS